MPFRPRFLTFLLSLASLSILSAGCGDEPSVAPSRSAIGTAASGPGGGSDPAVASIVLNPTDVVAGTNSVATVTLTGAAPSGGTVVGCTSNNTSVATVPPALTIPAGSTSGSFAVTSHPVASPDFAAISATAGQVTRTAVLNVSPGSGATLSALSISPTVVSSGGTATGTVTLNGGAPTGGASVSLSSSNTAVATVPPSVTVAPGATTATFSITAQTVASATSVSITGVFGGVSRFASLTVTEPAPTGRQLSSLTLASTQVVGGQSVQGTVTLASATGAATAVSLSSTNTAVAQVPATVTVPANVASATFTVTTSPTTSTGFAEISASAGGVSRFVSLTTVPPPTGPSIVSVVFFPSNLGGTGPATGRVTLSGPATQGAGITLTSGNPGVVQVPDQIVVSANTSRVDFPVTTSKVTSNTTVTITAVACCGGQGSATGSITVTTAAPPPPDVVRVDQADFQPGGRGGTLRVRATSTSSTAILTVFRDASTVPTFVLTNQGGGRYEGSFSFSGVKPGTVTVKSNLGGSATATVK